MDRELLSDDIARGLAENTAGKHAPSRNWLAHAAATFALILVLAYDGYVFLPYVASVLEHNHVLRLIVYPSLLWMAMGTLLLIFRTAVWLFYRPAAPETFETAPFVTVVIPAYNEGGMVMRSILSAVEARYPRDRLEILVVDDGSTDDTWSHIRAATAQYPRLVVPLQHERNRGKRAALAWGFERARGDIIVTLDSDSVVDRDALLALAGPFRNPRVGAVAGKVVVYNRRGLIPRMLHARFVITFDFLRTAESAYGNVFCCPGALTAMRASAIRPLVSRWKSQKFLGEPCTIGEDRAMTNFLFEAGFDTVYQNSAVVRTVVPETFGQLCRMLLRWDRSYVREEFHFARILGKRPLKARVIAFCDRLVTNLRYPISYLCMIMVAAMMFADPWTMARMLAAIGIISLLNMVYFIRSERSLEFLWGVVYAYFAVFALSWIFPYAVMTVRRPGWLTR
jgi:hyaluronan synthase